MSSVDLIGVHKSYDTVQALKPLDMKIEEGEFLTLLGPSGCGKTTTLRIVAGFVAPTGGSVIMGGADITHTPPQKRNIGMVFQDYALFPHMTVAQNIGFGLQERGYSKADTTARVAELLDLVRMPDAANRYPSEISGGQQQRVAVARAVAYTPGILLMDEPLGALDLKLREAMQFEIRRIQQELKITTIYVTHDQVEAMAMSDRIAVMNRGVVEQIGAAREIYDRPKTRFVANFIGQINLLEGSVRAKNGAGYATEVSGLALFGQSTSELAAGRKVAMAVRPEAITLMGTATEAAGKNVIPGQVSEIGYSGNIARVTVTGAGGITVVAEVRPHALDVTVGDPVHAVWDADRALLLTE